MKSFAIPLAVAMLVSSGAANACGTHAPALQAEIDARELAELQRLARAAAREAEQIYVGTVTDLTRPAWGSQEMGSVSFAVHQTLKGEPAPSQTAQWKDKFIYSCQSPDMFHNVGFRPGGRFIVYVRAGKVFRSDAADHLRSGLLSLDQEQAIAVTGGGS